MFIKINVQCENILFCFLWCMTNILSVLGQRTSRPSIFRDQWYDTTLKGNSYFAEIRRRYKADSWEDAVTKCKERFNAGLGRFLNDDFEKRVAAYLKIKTSIFKGTT